MATTSHRLASGARLGLLNPSRPSIGTLPSFLAPFLVQTRNARQQGPTKASLARKKERAERKKARGKYFKTYKSTLLDKYSLCDAMRYIRAFEVGNPPPSTTYSLAIKLKTGRDGAILRGKVLLPHKLADPSVVLSSSELAAKRPRIAVICAPDSPAAASALALGAVAVGEESIIESVRNGTYTFNKLLCHVDSAGVVQREQKMLGPALGRKGLMPHARSGTVVRDVEAKMRELMAEALGGGEGEGENREYREREGVIRVSVGAMWFTPRMLAENIKAAFATFKDELYRLERDNPNQAKSIDEVVLATTRSAGFSLNGRMPPSEGSELTEEQLEGQM